MVKCEYCVNFDGKRCTDLSGALYGKDIENPLKDIKCGAYIDKYFAYDSSQDLF